jgi:hypothetical protein
LDYSQLRWRRLFYLISRTESGILAAEQRRPRMPLPHNHSNSIVCNVSGHRANAGSIFPSIEGGHGSLASCMFGASRWQRIGYSASLFRPCS